MKINRLTVTNFRNAEKSDIGFDGGVNIICGENAAGKTNLLEAIFYFAAGKSFRNCKDRELIRFGCDSAEINIEFEGSNGVLRKMSANFGKDTRRIIKLGDYRATKLSEYLGLFRAVIFTPDHLNLIKGAPENRRRFLDMAICQSFPRYAQSLSEFNKTLAQKNAFLKKGNIDNLLLEVYNERLASLSAIITVNRRKYTKRLEEESAKFLFDMSGGKEVLKTEYHAQCGVEFVTQEEIRDRYREILSERIPNERERALALYGAHKDDFGVTINGKSARMYGSQGQQRSVVLALKLAEGELSEKLTNEYPVFLLDDILSELDANRKEYILSRLEGRQVIITGCESEIFGIEGKNCIVVENGKIVSD